MQGFHGRPSLDAGAYRRREGRERDDPRRQPLAEGKDKRLAKLDGSPIPIKGAIGIDPEIVEAIQSNRPNMGRPTCLDGQSRSLGRNCANSNSKGRRWSQVGGHAASVAEW